jgi:sulfur-oxidizing protein SoxY
MKRRTFLKGTLAGSTLAVATGAGLLTPSAVLAGTWPKAAFDTKDAAAAINAVMGSSDAAASGDIKIKVPTQAENGAVVPIKIETGMDNVESIAVMIKNNPSPLASMVALSGNAVGFYSTRCKMGKTSPVTAYVKAGGKLYSASQTVKVTVGGCGG